MDNADRAALQSERILASRIKKDSQVANYTSETCWHCKEPTVNGARWCDTHCRDDWEKENN